MGVLDEEDKGGGQSGSGVKIYVGKNCCIKLESKVSLFVSLFQQLR